MKAGKVFITIDFDNVPGKFDYPQNVPLPRVGDMVLLDSNAGKVYEVRHVVTGKVADITIKVRQGDTL
jgi:hypothetical protein